MVAVIFLALALALSAQAAPRLHITLAGDSTVTDNGGWAPGFRAALGPDVEITNLAHSGASTVSYRKIGDWDKVLATKADYVLIQFGHNDVTGKGPGRETDAKTTFRENLSAFIDEARAAGMKPVLVTSVSHRTINKDGTFRFDASLAPYAEATRAVAADKHTPLIDLFKITSESYANRPREDVESLGRMIPGPDGKPRLDSTHFGPKGADETGRLAAKAFVEAVGGADSSLR